MQLEGAQYGPVAQLDRVLPSEGKGRAFESRRVRHPPDLKLCTGTYMRPESER